MSQFINPYPDAGFDTLAIRSGQRRTSEGEHNDPVFLTSSFVFDSAEQAQARFAETEPGNVYSRFTNPTVKVFENRLAALEGATYAVATASGMAAILSTCLAVLKAGDHVIASNSLFGSTTSLFSGTLTKFGIETTFVGTSDLDGWAAAVTPHTRMLFLETPTNPLGEIADIAGLSVIARTAGALLVVDNCFLTPAFQQPLRLGADVVVHSATKYLDGQGRCVGGAVVTCDAEVHKQVYATVRTGGSSMSPFNAWVFLNGIETLRLRMRAHGEAALEVAEWLDAQPAVKRVFFSGLPSHPQHALARKQQSGFGGTVSFELGGGREAAFAFINATRLFSITANLGDTKSTITHPASTTHGRLTPEQRAQGGITEGLIRLSVGLEDVADLEADLERGLEAAQAPAAGYAEALRATA